MAYLDGKGPKPARLARVVMVTNDSVVEYQVGPVDDLKNAEIKVLVPKGQIPYSKRPGFEESETQKTQKHVAPFRERLQNTMGHRFDIIIH